MRKNIFEHIYKRSGVIWTRTEPPKRLVRLVESRKINPCKTIDIGCGEGFYSIYLASRGFDVTGIDLSEKAIKYAKKNAVNHGVNVRFLSMDIDDLGKLDEKFDFVFEWSLLHLINPSRRPNYVEYVKNLLNNGGKYLSMCFNKPNLDGGKYLSMCFNKPNLDEFEKIYRAVILGIKLYFSGIKVYYSSQAELRELFEPYFHIIESKLIPVPGGRGPSFIGNYFLMEK